MKPILGPMCGNHCLCFQKLSNMSTESTSQKNINIQLFTRIAVCYFTPVRWQTHYFQLQPKLETNPVLVNVAMRYGQEDLCRNGFWDILSHLFTSIFGRSSVDSCSLAVYHSISKDAWAMMENITVLWSTKGSRVEHVTYTRCLSKPPIVTNTEKRRNHAVSLHLEFSKCRCSPTQPT